MLGKAQASLNVPPPRRWPPGRPTFSGLTAGTRLYNPLTESPAPAREALIESFYRRTSAVPPAGLGQEREPGQLLAFRSRQAAPAPHPRSREIAWRRAHDQELRALAGQWVIVEGNELIANGTDPRALVAAARARGIQVPYLFFVEPTDDNAVKFGL
jgi:hypothetical protein